MSRNPAKFWDVYAWPINNSSYIRLVAKNVEYDIAMQYYRQYFDSNIYDAYMVPAGTNIAL